jgi:acyl-CoA synthetase (AMP-forming)/AMP-acid ligase II
MSAGNAGEELRAHPDQWVAATPDKPAIVMIDSGESASYAELMTRANRAAHLLASLGIRAGDTIALLMENSIPYVELLWAAKNSGVRYVAVSTHLNAADAEYVVQDSGAALLVASHGLRDLALQAAEQLPDNVHLLMAEGTAGRFQPYETLRDTMPSTPLPDRKRGSSMLYSSGTTGRPKGVRTALADAPPEVPPQRYATMCAQYEFDAATRFMNPGPFYHAGPQRFMMMVHRAGGTVLSSRKFDALRTLEAACEWEASHGFFVPTMLRRMLRLPDETRARLTPKKMRHAIHSAAPCPHDVKREMIAWWGPVIDELYGGTEAFGHTFISSTEWLARPGSVGRPPQNCRVKIVGPDGAALPPGESGRIMMANGLHFDYHGQAAKNASPHDSEGFASLGDVGYLDTEGYLYLTDRESHMIIIGGANVYPQEAEQVLSQHPAVDDVAVIGIPHPDLGEEVKALVIANQPPSQALADDIMTWCRTRLSRFKSPRSLQFVDSLPRNDMGKLVKRMLPAADLSGPGPYRADGEDVPKEGISVTGFNF